MKDGFVGDWSGESGESSRRDNMELAFLDDGRREVGSVVEVTYGEDGVGRDWVTGSFFR